MKLSPHRFESRTEYLQTLHQALLNACLHGGRDMLWMDQDFANWPLSDPAVLSALSSWALPHRRLVLLATNYEALQRRHPRFVQWRQLHDHVVTAWQFDPQDVQAPGGAQAYASLLLAPGLWCLRLWDPLHWRGSLTNDAAEALEAREWFDAVAQRAVRSFGASVTGL